MQDGAEEKIITDSSFKVISKWGEKISSGMSGYNR